MPALLQTGLETCLQRTTSQHTPQVLQLLKCCSSTDSWVICLLPHKQCSTAEHIASLRCRRATQCLDRNGPVRQAMQPWLLLLGSLQVVPNLLQR